MTDADAFLAAIKANPDDDLPRLVYADWLEEHGEAERAEFIRVQCELGALHVRTPRDADRYRTLRERERELWVGLIGAPFNSILWFAECRSISISCGENVRRGFIDSITCPSAAWLTHGDAILAAHPVRTVRLTDRPEIVYGGEDDEMISLRGDPEQRWFSAYGLGAMQVRRGDLLFANDIGLCLTARYPGVAFELPAETWGNGMPMIPATPFVSDEEARILYGDPNAAQPLGIIEADESEAAAPEPRPRRPDFSHRGWQPRFPRPR